jgi:GAF domain-containing protein
LDRDLVAITDDAAHGEAPPSLRPEGSPTPPITAVPGLVELTTTLRQLSSVHGKDATLQLAVELASERVPGCELADIMVLGPRGTTTPVSTDPLALAIDALQTRFAQGPCRDAALEERVVRVGDLASDPRWPRFAPAAAKLGLRSVLSLQLYLERHDGDRFGALNLYSSTAHAFDDQAVEVAEVMAALCTSALASHIAREGLEAALDSRDVIGQAKGVLMARRGITAAEAFALLKDSSQEHNRRLVDIAEGVASTGELP